jgi:substrate-binding family protein
VNLPGLRRSTVALALLALAGTACGSTVPRAQLEAALQNGNGGQGLGGGTGGVGTGGTTGLGGTGGTTGLGGTGTAGVGTTGFAGGGGPLGPGLTSTVMYVGVVNIKNAGAANAALGATGSSTTVDWKKPYEIVIKDINAKGGIAGRKLAPIWADIDATSSQTIDQQTQAACATWTQDHKVFAILAGDAGGVIQECTEKARAVNIIPAGDSTPDDFRRYPHYVEPSGMHIVRMGPVTVKGIAAQGYFDKGTRLGIITWDQSNYREAIRDGYLPALRQQGITPATDISYVHVPQTFNDLGGMNSDVNSAVLRFSGQDIDHVMIIDGSAGICAGACLGYEFMNQAQSQDYHPRYGFNDFNYADTSVDSLYPHQQLVGSVAVVWGDPDDAHDVGYHVNKSREDCYKLMKDNGFDYDATDDNQTYVIRTACEQIWFMRAVVGKMGNAVLNNDNFMAGVNQIGSSFQSLSTYVARISATQHDGASAVRNERYFESCTCYKFTSAPYEV